MDLSVNISVRLPQATADAIRIRAEKEDRKISDMIRVLILRALRMKS